MIRPTIAGNLRTFSAFNILDGLGRALHEIKAQDGLTWADLGAVLGVSDDQAAKYAEGTASMNAVTLARGKKEWGSRFTGYFDRLCGEGTAKEAEDRRCESAVLRAALTLSQALADDNRIDAGEILKSRSELEEAGDAIAIQLGKLKPAAA